MIKNAKSIKHCIVFFLFAFFIGFFNVAFGEVNIKPLSGVKILLDAGHGGFDPGAIGPNGLKESHVNLRVVRYLKYLLEADGATVYLTRSKDESLTLSDRIKLANAYSPHLFFSIHHNSSLSPRKKTRAELYYAAADYGISKMLASSMRNELAKAAFGEDSVVMPGGFYLLRNSPCPAVITESAYISVADSEILLMTGKHLTNQAQALRTAIKSVIPSRVLNVDAYLTEPLILTSPYFNFILTSDKPIESINGRLTTFPGAFFFGFERMLGWCNSYKLYNMTPLHSGDFLLNLMFQANDKSISPRKNIKFSVKLPVSNILALPIAPYIPKGFKGKFPILVTLSDALGRPNTRKANVKITSRIPNLYKINRLAAVLSELASLNLTGFTFYEQVCENVTSDKGDAILYINLNGDENGFVLVNVESEGVVSEPIQIPIQDVDAHYVRGRLFNKSESVGNAKILFGDKSTISTRNGYFFFETHQQNLTLDIIPPLGFSPLKYKIASMCEPVNMPLIEVEKVSENLYGKTIGIISSNGFDLQVRKLTSLLLRSGCSVIRFKSDEKLKNPEYQNVLDANLHENLVCLLSFKNSGSNKMSIRHYHRKGTGSKIAKKLCEAIELDSKNIKAEALPGSDYEINHSQATALVLDFPQKVTDRDTYHIVEKLYQVLNDELK